MLFAQYFSIAYSLSYQLKYHLPRLGHRTWPTILYLVRQLLWDEACIKLSYRLRLFKSIIWTEGISLISDYPILSICYIYLKFHFLAVSLAWYLLGPMMRPRLQSEISGRSWPSATPKEKFWSIFVAIMNSSCLARSSPKHTLRPEKKSCRRFRSDSLCVGQKKQQMHEIKSTHRFQMEWIDPLSSKTASWSRGQCKWIFLARIPLRFSNRMDLALCVLPHHTLQNPWEWYILWNQKICIFSGADSEKEPPSEIFDFRL